METQYISLNMTPTGVNPCFHISQYDVGRMLGFIVHSGGATVDLDTYTCTVEATRSDGTAITSAVATTENIGTFEVTPTMSNKADKYRCQLVIVDENSKRIASLPFDMEVTKAAMDENSEAIEEDASLYQQYTEAVQGAIAEANADIQAEENARIAAVNAEATTRANADTALQNNINDEATARQTADNTLQGNINSETATRASADSNLQSQINQIISPSGEAPSAAEVQNARIGADGVTYGTLGDAIRTNDNTLNSKITLFDSGISGALYPCWKEDGYKYYLVNNVITRYADANYSAFDYRVDIFSKVKLEVASTSFDYYIILLKSDKSLVTASQQKETIDGHCYVTLTADTCYIRISKNNTIYTSNPVVYGIGSKWINDVKKEVVKEGYIYGRIDEIEVLQGYYSNNNNWYKTGLGRLTKKYYIKNSDIVEIKGNFPSYGRIYTLLDESGNVIDYYNNNSSSAIDFDQTIDTKNAQWLLICNGGNGFAVTNGGTIVKAWHKIEPQLFGKNILWLGTSIPAGGGEYSYPKRVGRKTGAIVNNQAVGNSCVACKLRSRINADTNPYGFIQYFKGASRCLSNTIEEMTWITNWIDYRVNGGTYQNEGSYDANVFTVDVPTTWTADDTALSLSCSYENKILPLFQADTNIPDIVVFDHGFNDWPVINTGAEDDYERDIETYGRYNMYTYRGCCNFLLDLMQSYNNDITIIMSTPYLTVGKQKTIARNKTIAEDYGIQLVELEKLTGWTADFSHEYYGAWTGDGLWIYNATPQTLQPLYAAIPDHIHPDTDHSGSACRKLQNIFVDALIRN